MQLEYRADMERCLNFIDTHLAEPITPQGLARMLNYSYFHFCHVFRSMNGMAVSEYLRDRRLYAAASELAGGKKVTDAAFDCDFGTVSGFTRAFTRKFGVSPSKYKKMKGGIWNMKPEIKKFAGFTVIGYVLKPDSTIDLLDSGAYWLGRDFSSVSKEDYAKLTYPGYAEVGMWMHADKKGPELYYFFGPVVNNTDFVPKGMEIIIVPEAEYAVFTVPNAENANDLHENITKTWKFIFNDWFDHSAYKFDQEKMDFEYYCGKDSFIYVPILKK